VSSSTSNFNASRRFVLGLAVLVSIPALSLFALGVHLQPLYGDLTRLGGYAERDFGPNKPQQEFATLLYSNGPYAGYKDVVVLGDSFSHGWPKHQWQNYLAAKTGWAIHTLDVNVVSVRKIIDSAAYRAAPPKLFIYQSVERNLPKRINDGQVCGPATFPERYWRFGPVPVAAHVMPLLHNRKQDWRDVNLSFSAKYLTSTLRRKFMGSRQGGVEQVALTRPGLFSSKNSDTLLVYTDDITSAAEWKEANLSDMACQVERMRRLIEANGRTRFVMMVAPNKLSAYANFLVNSEMASLSRLNVFMEKNVGVMVRVDSALAAAIRTGEQDVYLPDDTHWSARGNEIAADAVLDLLRSSHR
jgi:hypothetical protein